MADPVRLLREGLGVKPRVWLSILILAAVAFGGWKLIEWRNRPPEVNFTRAVRETIVSSVSTNGKVEPAEYGTARAETGGPVERILVQLRQRVEAGAALVVIDSSRARGDLEAANARIAAAEAELRQIEQGGRSADIAAIQRQIDSAQVALTQAREELRKVESARAKNVATLTEVTAARNNVERLEQEIQSLQRQKQTLVAPTDQQAAQARLREAQTARQQAELQIQRSTVRAPISGTIYEFDLKPGAYLNPGDVVASIGKLDPVHVNVFVDEPDLGRVAVGKSVTITWDAKPGQKWTGKVDRMPARIVELGTRQVGEVVTVIANPDYDLLPGTNVTAEIVAETVENAVTIPKEALFRQQEHSGVYLLKGDHIEWHPVTPGVSNVTRTAVAGLQEGDQVALPSDRPLMDGMQVQPVLQ